MVPVGKQRLLAKQLGPCWTQIQLGQSGNWRGSCRLPFTGKSLAHARQGREILSQPWPQPQPGDARPAPERPAFSYTASDSEKGHVPLKREGDVPWI